MSVERGTLTVIQGSTKSRQARNRPILQGFKLHAVGVEIEEWVDQRTWYEFGKLLQQMDYAWEWVVADWLAFGDHKYGDHVYTTASRLFGKSARTWEDYAYIARNVRSSERSEILPVLLHKPVARFGDDPEMQRRLLGIAEQHGLSKAIFEAVIELYLAGKPYDHLLPSELTPVARARMRADKDRERVRKRALTAGGTEWLEYARDQAEGWAQLVRELAELLPVRSSATS
ncbi:MAG TPA: hypothetical protein VF339_19785 [Gammaproteobacteria bacterium]